MKFIVFCAMVLFYSFATAVAWRIGVVLSITADYPFGLVFYNSLWAFGLGMGFVWFVFRLFSRRAHW